MLVRPSHTTILFVVCRWVQPHLDKYTVTVTVTVGASCHTDVSFE
jgi:hypothetical protein